jgi:phosphoribosylanthranilate isomerase
MQVAANSREELPMSVKVKICGLTNMADAQVAVEAGADFLGFILYAKSPRYIPPEQIARILTELALPSHVQTVGVFVNTPVDEVLTILDQTGLDLAQLHGDEPEAALATLAGRGFKALRPTDSAAVQQSNLFTVYPQNSAPQLLVDAYHPSGYGGTGHKADWALATAIAQLTPRLLLAGGLTAANIQIAIEAVAPWGVDVGSGVEVAPGRKDHDQVRAFVANAHSST